MLRFYRGLQIVYVPDHAEGDLSHPDCEPGFVTSVPFHGVHVFCRYWSKSDPKTLRTKANSERTDRRNLVVKATHTAVEVFDALDEFC